MSFFVYLCLFVVQCGRGGELFGLNKSNINKQMKKVRKDNKDAKIHEIEKNIKKHYATHIYSEKELLNRLSKLKTESFFWENIIASLIGSFMGLIASNMDFYQEKCTESRFMCFALVMIISIVIVVGVINLFKYFCLRMNNSIVYIDLVDEKEIKIIKSIIDNRGKEKRPRVPTRKKYKYFRKNY